MKTTFEYVIGIIGHPTTPDVSWSDPQLMAMQHAGFNTLQLSIAWSWRPAGEVLNLENLDDPSHMTEWRRRVAQAEKFGFRTLAHFGLPVGPQLDATTCILDPEVREGYARRLRDFFREFPSVTDIMVYTYDQLAWLCSEFGDCPRCKGIPLHDRLPGFLAELNSAAQVARPGVRFWWEPWELSEGQILAILDRLDTPHFGLILHNTIAEVQFVNQTDLSFRNIARAAKRRGIPVVGEGFFGGSGEDIAPLTHLACPRLVHQQLHALRQAEGVVGIKEYYGMVPAHFSVNVAMLKQYLRNPDWPVEELLSEIAADYGDQASAPLLQAWEWIATAMETFPWNASWALRRIFEKPLSEEWQEVPGASWMTPAWQANRRGFYMVTDLADQHPWLKEDVGLRAVKAAELFEEAAKHLAEAEKVTTRPEDVRQQRLDVALAAQSARHFGEQLLSHRAARSRDH
jgi:hypothetical protein